MLKKQSKKITKAKEEKDTLRFLQQISKEDLAVAIMIVKPGKKEITINDIFGAIEFIGTDKNLIKDIFDSAEKILSLLTKIVIDQNNDLRRRN